MKQAFGKQISLCELLSEFVAVDAQYDRLINGIAIDSRKVKSGDLFLAYKGEVQDGHKFIAEAVKKGASAIVCEDHQKTSMLLFEKVPLIIIPGLKEKVGLIAAKFYGYPSRHLTVIGITGTSGKTSCAYFIAEALSSLGSLCGFIGTIGAGFPGKLTPLINTTPDAVTIQKTFFELLNQGAKAVAMEVSSHSLVQDRVKGVVFKIAVFTNLSRDHLDYHQDMQEYGLAKKILFTYPSLQAAIINIDDEFGQKLIKQLATDLQVYAYSIQDQTAGKGSYQLVSAANIKLDLTGIKAQIKSPWGSGDLKSQLLGRFNVSNLLAVFTVLELMGIAFKDALAALTKLSTVNGRMQMLGGGKKPLVVIDYAHKPDPLEQVLKCLREHCTGSLWCVFGCGGDRDRGKRPLMGEIAERLSDHIIITNDNPRTENPEQIVNDILQGLLCPWAAEIEYDRRAAIAHAIDCAKENDVILIAGKGHEDYQIIGKEKTHFSDYEEAEKQLEKAIKN